MRRFYAPEIDPGSGTVVLDREQSAHVRSVLRLTPGALVNIFDGRGSEFECVVASVRKDCVTLEIGSRTEPPAPESPLRLTLGVGLLKNDKFDLVTQKAVELGVNSLVPVIASRSEVRAEGVEKRRARLEKIIVEASKQCGRATLLDLAPVVPLNEFLSGSIGRKFFFSERSGEPLPQVSDVSEVTALVGPEGGWEESEQEAAVAAGFTSINLGARILRAETAAIAVSALIQNRYGDLT